MESSVSRLQAPQCESWPEPGHRGCVLGLGLPERSAALEKIPTCQD